MPESETPASQLAKQRWAKVPKKQRQKIATALSRARWDKPKPKARKKPK